MGRSACPAGLPDLFVIMIIAFEGPDGCGKSTQMKMVAEAALQRGFTSVHTYKNPGSTPFADILRTNLLKRDDLSQKERMCGMLAALASVEEVFAEHVRKPDSLILLDRWLLSTCIYQGSVELSPYFIHRAGCALLRFPEPDLYLVYEVPAEVSLQRLADRGDPRTVFETDDNLGRVCEAYELAPVYTNARVIAIDGKPRVDIVWDHTARAVFGSHETDGNS